MAVQRVARTVVSLPFLRGIVAVYAMGASIASIAWLNVRAYEHFAPWLWPSWFAITAVLCWAFVACPGSDLLYRLSGACYVVAVLSRIGGVATNLIWDHQHLGPNRYPTVWYGVIGIVVWPLFALSIVFVWHLAFGLLHRAYQHPGDRLVLDG